MRSISYLYSVCLYALCQQNIKGIGGDVKVEIVMVFSHGNHGDAIDTVII